MSGAGLLVQIIAVIITPILSRLYSPNDFGTFGTLNALVYFFSIIAASRFDYAFFIKKNNLQYFFVLSIISVVVFTIIASIILPRFFNYSFSILFPALFSIAIYNIATQFSVALLRYKELSISRAMQGIIQYGFALVFGSILLYQGLIYSFIIGQIVASYFLLTKLKIHFNISLGKLLSIFKDNIRYSINSTFISAMQWSTPIAPMLIGNFIFSSHTLGIYFLITQSISAVTSIPRRSLINICTSELNTSSKFKDSFIPFFHKFILDKFSTYIIMTFLIISLTFYLFGQDIVGAIWGEQWRNGGKYIGIIIFFSMIELFSYPFMHLLNLWGKYSIAMQIEIPRFMCVFFIIPMLSYHYKLNFSIYVLGHFFCMFLFNLMTFITLIKISNYTIDDKTY